MRPVEYILSKRVSEAKLLLVSTDMKIGEIALRVGFSEQNYFGIIFRRYTGLTPTDYRRQRL
jgi:two-component system response regulator YesN